MPSVARCLLAFGVVVPALLDASAAFACGALPCAQINDIQPVDGSTGVALNTELRVLYFGTLEPFSEDGACTADVENVRLVPSEGDPIQLQGKLHERASGSETWVVAKPELPLAANTAYALQLQLGQGVDACRCEDREWVTVSSFTSAVDVDRVAPAFAGISALTYGARTMSSTSCGSEDGLLAVPELTAATDDFPGPRYNVYVNGQLANRYLELFTADAQPSSIFVDCGSYGQSPWGRVQPGDSVEVRAIDLAGNESFPNEPIEVDVSCGSPDTSGDGAPSPTEPVAEAGTDEVLGGPGLANTPSSSRSSPGCALSHGLGANPSAALAALFMLFAWRRRR